METALPNWWQAPEFWAALVAAIAAIVAAVISAVVAWRQRGHQRELMRVANRFTESQRQVDFHNRQLIEFYGPLLLLRQASRTLRGHLPDQDASGRRWRLVDHIEEIKQSEDNLLRSAAEELIAINKEIEQLLLSRGALMVFFPPPESFTDFIAHSRLLRFAWEQGMNQSGSQRQPFPDQLDDDIREGINEVNNRLQLARANARAV